MVCLENKQRSFFHFWDCTQVLHFGLFCFITLPTKVHLFKAVNHKGKQSWIFTGRTDAQAPMLWPLMQRTDSLERTLLLGKIEGRRSRGHRRWAGLMASPTQWTWVWTSSGRWWRAGKPGMLQSLGVTELDTTEWLNNNSRGVTLKG